MAPSVPALTRALDMFELFLANPSPLSVPEITTALGLPRSTVHDLVKTLAERNYLEGIEGTPRRYRPGLRLFQLGGVYISGVDLARLGQQLAAETASLCDETVQVAILEQADVIYIAKADSSQALRLVSSIGGRLPANCTACGKALLATLEDAKINELYRGVRSLPSMTPASVTSLTALKAQLAEVRRTGVAYEYCESNNDAACIAAPVYDRSGQVVAAMSMSVPVLRWVDELRPAREKIILEAAERLSRRLGYRMVDVDSLTA